MAELLNDALFGPDGTQPLAPMPVLPDPLAGLVTGEIVAGGAGGGFGGFAEWDRQSVVASSPPAPPAAQPMPAAVSAILAEDRLRARRRPVAPARPRTSPAVQPTFASTPNPVTPYSFSPAPMAPRPSTPTAPATATPRQRRGGRGWLGIIVVIVVIGAIRYGGAIADLLTRLLHR